MSKLDTLLVSVKDTLREVMTCIDRNSRGIALVVDEDHHLLETLTDGDIRRAILDGLKLDMPALELVERKKQRAIRPPVTAPSTTPQVELVALMQAHRIRHIPLVDDCNRVLDLVTLDDLLPGDPLPLQAVIMAGGFGKRLFPLTKQERQLKAESLTGIPEFVL